MTALSVAELRELAGIVNRSEAKHSLAGMVLRCATPAEASRAHELLER